MKSRGAVLFVGIIALFSWWLLSTEEEKHFSKTENDHFIDAFINNFTITSTDETGRTVYTLKADRLEHFNDTEYSRIFNPTINIPQENNHWQITANFGEIDSRQIIIKLHENVIMKKMDSKQDFELETQSMTINTKSQIINSNQSVKIRNGSLKLVSDGMRYNSKKKLLKLLSNVNGTYIPR